jgi:hypothetical protein
MSIFAKILTKFLGTLIKSTLKSCYDIKELAAFTAHKDGSTYANQ